MGSVLRSLNTHMLACEKLLRCSVYTDPLCEQYILKLLSVLLQDSLDTTAFGLRAANVEADAQPALGISIPIAA